MLVLETCDRDQTSWEEGGRTRLLPMTNHARTRPAIFQAGANNVHHGENFSLRLYKESYIDKLKTTTQSLALVLFDDTQKLRTSGEAMRISPSNSNVIIRRRRRSGSSSMTHTL